MELVNYFGFATFLGLALSCQASKFSNSSQSPAGQKPVSDAADSEASSQSNPETSSNPKDPSSQQEGRNGERRTEEFPIAKQEGNLDLVWAIDNSGSMKEEVDQVRQNFSKFLQSIQGRSGVKLALIAATKTSQKASLFSKKIIGIALTGEELGQGNIQLDIPVASTDALEIIVQQMSQGLKAFFRPESRKVFVVVTDDNASNVDHTNFLELLKPSLGEEPPHFFAFRGLESQPGCSIASRGTAYEELAKQTGGSVFDICETNWLSYFGQLSEKVIQIANSTFTLKNPAEEIYEVVIDSRKVEAEKYRLKGNMVHLDVGTLTATDQLVTISYRTAP